MASIECIGPGGARSSLRGGMAFVLYWCEGGGHRYFPVGLEDGLEDGKDMSPKRGEAGPDDLVQFRFFTSADVLSERALRGSLLEFRTGGSDWAKPVLRKAAEPYFAAYGDNTMSSVRSAFVYPEGVRFALGMNVDGFGDVGDIWISGDDNRGIVMLNQLERRASLVAVRYGDDYNNPFGDVKKFNPMTDQDLGIV